MMRDDSDFFAWLDGELDDAESARMAAKVAADPELTNRAEQHLALNATLRGAFDPVSAAPVPAALAETVRPRATVIDLAAAREAHRPRVSGGWTLQAAAMAASLAVGLLVGRTLIADRAGLTVGPVSVAGGQLIAASALRQSLTSSLASEPAQKGARIVLSFRNQKGAICRSFVDGATSGLACRDGAEWRLRGLFQGEEGQAGTYRMAAGPDPALAALVDAEIAGDPLDSSGEAKAKARGWR
jgi:hypothetical protein